MNCSYNLKKSLKIALLISGLLVGCGNPDKKTDRKATGPFHPRIIFKDQTAPEEFQKLITEFRVIPIEYSTDKIIGEIDIVKPDGDDFLVLDYNDQSIKKISHDGKITGSFSHRGKGPGEYRTLDDFLVHPDTHEIIVVGASSKKIIFYDSSGIFLREFKLDFWGRRMALLSEDKIICFSDRVSQNDDPPFYQLNIIDLQGRILRRYHPYDIPWSTWVFSRSELIPNNNEIFVHTFFDYNLFRINQQMDLDTLVVFDFGTHAYDTSGFARLSQEESGERRTQSPRLLFQYGTFVFEDYCYLTAGGNDMGSYWGYGRYDQDFIVHKNINNGRYLCFYNGWPVIAPMGKIGNELVSWIDLVHLLDIWDQHPEEKVKAESHPEFKKIMDKMDIEGNPVLMLYSLRRE
ncbi:MAG: 6-bladed beta-propeller [Porphyromonadaceae bacterium]|nr:MAG: 6-bladed beta-propeller [Porphyromonadaceae bacterium]